MNCFLVKIIFFVVFINLDTQKLASIKNLKFYSGNFNDKASLLKPESAAIATKFMKKKRNFGTNNKIQKSYL